MRTHLFGSLALAVLITAGAGCAADSNVQVEVEPGTPGMPGIEVEVDAGAAGGTQLEGTPAVNDTPDADINLDAEVGAEVMIGGTKSFTVIGDNFKYDVKELRVKKGDTVRLTFRNAEGFHDLKIDEFGVDTGKLQAGGENTVEFVADEAGTFEYYCSVGSHRAMGMVGQLIVE